jgi:ATP-dependent Clp protease ATP-binding subunit ClpC
MNNFTPRIQQTLRLAGKEACRLGHNHIGAEHFLLGIIKLGQGVAWNVLSRLITESGAGRTPGLITSEILRSIGEPDKEELKGNIPYTPILKKVLSIATEEAETLGHKYVGTEHVLIAIMVEGESVSAKTLFELGLDLEKVRGAVLKELNPDPLDTGDVKGQITKLLREACQLATRNGLNITDFFSISVPGFVPE